MHFKLYLFLWCKAVFSIITPVFKCHDPSENILICWRNISYQCWKPVHILQYKMKQIFFPLEFFAEYEVKNDLLEMEK